jgi:predicted enzyme related to lactoylglutathione lyase
MSNSKLPEHSSLEYLRKLAKARLEQMRQAEPDARLAGAQLLIAREYGFTSWRALKAQLDSRRMKRQITNPAMRFIGVASLDRAVIFYRDVMGFQIKQQADVAEAVLGPVRIRLGKAGFSPGGWSTPRPPGSAILFLETGDVETAHAELRRRGGTPSEIEKVNWIKMRMFEIRDPDGNVLWLGQSYHEQTDSPSRRKSQPRGLRKALPELPFDDVAAAVAYYRDVLGFRINYQQDDLGVMDRDAITILLIARTQHHQGIGSCEVFVEDADALYEELQAKGAKLDGPPVSHPWGLRDFRTVDPEGNRITFAQTFE